MRPQALLFDLDDTLILERAPIEAAYAAVARRVWGVASAERVDALWEAARAVWRAGRPEAYARRVHFSLGEALHGEFVATGPGGPDELRAFVPRLHAAAFDAVLPPGWRGRSPELVALWARERIAALRVFDDALESLAEWSQRVPLALVTNGASALQREKIAACGLGAFFAAVSVAEEVGIGKPAPAMFEAALRDLGVDADDAVMVGNDAERDVAGARAAGVASLWLRRDADPAELGPGEIGGLRQLSAAVSVL